MRTGTRFLVRAFLLAWILVAARGLCAASGPPGAPVDVVPFGEMSRSKDGKEVVVLWEDARDIVRVVVRWADVAALTEPGAASLQYWQSAWPQRRIPRDRKSGSGSSGWLDIGDWYKGKWREPDATVERDGAVWTYTFNPVNAREFTDLGGFDARYRTTLKLRLAGEKPLPKIDSLEVYTDSVWRAADVAIEWGGAAKAEQTWDGRLEVFNGSVEKIEPLDANSAIERLDGNAWRSKVANRPDGIRARIRYAEVQSVNSFDETVVTVRAAHAMFSFAMADVLRGEQIFIPDYGVLVKKADLPGRYADAQQAWEKTRGANLYERIFDAPEQTFTQAWNDMPAKAPHDIALSFEGGRQHFRLHETGDVWRHKGWLERIRGKDSDRCLWDGQAITYRFGLPDSPPVQREIARGDLPIVASKWRRDGVEYEQTAYAVPFNGVPSAGERIEADDTLVLMVSIKLANTGPEAAEGRLDLSVRHGKGDALAYDDGLVFAEGGEPKRLRMALDTNGQGNVERVDNRLAYRVPLKQSESHVVFIAVPFLTLTDSAEWVRLRRMNFDERRDAVARYWDGRLKQGAQIQTPEPMINEFYRAHVAHLLINTEREVGSDRAMAKVGTFHYGVFSNESVMMLTDLDRRGYPDVARRGYETWLHYQGTVALPGDYSTHDGVFYGAVGYEMGGYNQHHGWVLWGLGEHYWYTRDRVWLAHAAPHVVKACDWITNERRRTIEAAKTSRLRAIEKGLLPPGSLEDIGDWRCWLSTNVYSWWGMDNAARALADIGHPEAARLQADARAYRADLVAAFTEAMRRSPVVRLRDGSWVPHVPSEVHRRGRSFGWLTETLEGAIHLVRCGVFDPHDPISTWIVKDYEDNLYLSEQFGYNIAGAEFDRHWFSRGGISQQANLLCNPIAYLLRDEPKHFLRAYFNAFAASYFPDTRMMTEHALPNIGDWRGDHYKASDEANSTYWLRLMFIHERGDELWLGGAIPRYWLADGQKIGIENAATYFGPMSMSMQSGVAKGRIEMRIDPPARNAPRAVRARFRHPDDKPIVRVEVNGRDWKNFDAATQWVALEGLSGRTQVVAHFE